MVSFLNVADVQSQLNINGGSDFIELVAFVESACDVVEQWCGPISVRTVTEQAFGTGSGFVLRAVPVVALSAVTYVGDLGSVSPVPTVLDFMVDAESGIVSRFDRGRVDGPYTLTYTAGYPSVPAWARLAAIIIAQNLWETRRGPRRGASDSSTTGYGYAIPNQAAALMAPHRRVRVGI